MKMKRLLVILILTAVVLAGFQVNSSSLLKKKDASRDTLRRAGMGWIIYSPSDSVKCETILKNALAQELDKKSVSQRVLALCKTFMGTPYVGATLEGHSCENLVLNLSSLDCTTFLENVVAFESVIRNREITFSHYCNQLMKVRYRHGEIKGYASRLHYFSDWIMENERKGLVQNVTKEIGGEPLSRKVNFMTSHRDLYKPLKIDSLYKEIQLTEEMLTNKVFYYIPKAKVQELEKNFEGGDLIAITTSVEGLDITHVGFAVFQNKRLHLLHASLGGKKVEISQKPLSEYLAGFKTHTGVMVARIKAE
jgi:hypothetical protein